MRRFSRLSSAFALAALFGLGHLVGCVSGQMDDADQIARQAALEACGLNDGTVELDADLRACDPNNKKKTTICHVPPGNPANAHTLCIGNAGVAAHLRNHDDYLGPCKRETTCPPPGGMGGAPGAGGSGGAAGAGGTPGGGGSQGGTGGEIIE
jgi:uncharacterized membrane protein YgcG